MGAVTLVVQEGKLSPEVYFCTAKPQVKCAFLTLKHDN